MKTRSHKWHEGEEADNVVSCEMNQVVKWTTNFNLHVKFSFVKTITHLKLLDQLLMFWCTAKSVTFEMNHVFMVEHVAIWDFWLAGILV